MKVPGRILLLVAAGCSAAVALLHVAIAVFGPPWYRWFGAPSLAARIEAGAALVPVLLTVAVAALFVVWACYALSGAGAIRRLPLLRAVLFTIAAIYLLRGIQVVPEAIAVARGAIPVRFAMFSAFSALAGAVYLWGVVRIGRQGRSPEAPAA
ncbi:MAG TPA: hypothetical protein VEH62_05655 [Gemmatimonadales bacterium]|nr:hypothetical protein [Gemmatimonadales bacterium]